MIDVFRENLTHFTQVSRVCLWKNAPCQLNIINTTRNVDIW